MTGWYKVAFLMACVGVATVVAFPTTNVMPHKPGLSSGAAKGVTPPAASAGAPYMKTEQEIRGAKGVPGPEAKPAPAPSATIKPNPEPDVLPATPAEVGQMLSAYWAKAPFSAFLPAVDLLYENQERDDLWAAPVEQKFAQDASAVGGMEIRSGDCRAGLCRYVVQFTGPTHEMTTLVEFGRRFVDSFPESHHGVTLYYKAEGQQGCVMYVFSLNPHAPYVRQLHDMLERDRAVDTAPSRS